MVPTLVENRALVQALIFLHNQIRPNRSTVLNFGIILGSFRLFYTLIEFLGI